MRIVRWMCDVKIKDSVSSIELRDREMKKLHNLGTTAKQVTVVWACVVKGRQ